MPGTVLGTGDADEHDRHSPFPSGINVPILSMSMRLYVQVWEQETEENCAARKSREIQSWSKWILTGQRRG